MTLRCLGSLLGEEAQVVIVHTGREGEIHGLTSSPLASAWVPCQRPMTNLWGGVLEVPSQQGHIP